MTALVPQPAEGDPQGCVLTNWVLPANVPPWFRALFDRTRRFGLAILWDGTWLDTETGDAFRRTHLECLLRREYRDLFPDSTASQTKKAVSIYLSECERGAADFLRRGQWHSKTTLEVTHETLPN